MTSTNSDLARLIEISKKGIAMSDAEAIEFNRLWMKNPPALLAILEAAEAVCRCDSTYAIDWDPFHQKLMQAWRRSCGEGE
jgi:hypothetical protein